MTMTEQTQTKPQGQITLEGIRVWIPTVVTVLTLVVWMVNGHNTAQALSRDLEALKTTTEREHGKLVTAFNGLATEVKALSVSAAEGRAERNALRRTLDRVEARCCGGQ